MGAIQELPMVAALDGNRSNFSETSTFRKNDEQTIPR